MRAPEPLSLNGTARLPRTVPKIRVRIWTGTLITFPCGLPTFPIVNERVVAVFAALVYAARNAAGEKCARDCESSNPYMVV